MAIIPRRIRQLPPALPPKGDDVFPISQMGENGIASTRAMTRDVFQSDLIEVINQARQQFVVAANTEHAHLQEQLDQLQSAVEQNEVNDANIQSALLMVQQMMNGESGKTPYDLWLEAGNQGTMTDYLNSMIGPQGPKGETGNQGIPGIQGSIGPVGPTGPMGPSGPEGAKGEKGEPGPQGTTGSVGQQGPVGPIGPKGDTGQQGPQGIAGATLLGTIIVSETALIALTAGARRVTVTTPASYGVAAGQNLLVFPLSVPSGLYATHDVIATGPNTLSVGVSAPLLAVGANYSIQCRLVRINT